MRRFAMVLAVGLCMSGLAVTAQGQEKRLANDFMTGVNPRNLQFTPINTGAVMTPRSTSQNLFRSPTPFKLFNIGNLFPKLNFSLVRPSTVPFSTYPQGFGALSSSTLPTMQVQTTNGRR